MKIAEQSAVVFHGPLGPELAACPWGQRYREIRILIKTSISRTIRQGKFVRGRWPRRCLRPISGLTIDGADASAGQQASGNHRRRVEVPARLPSPPCRDRRETRSKLHRIERVEKVCGQAKLGEL